MRPIPRELILQFDNLLTSINLPDQQHGQYKKWLRFYLDFCQKYGYKEKEVKSLPNFLEKLKVKRQTVDQQNQASHAVSLFYKLSQLAAQKPEDKTGKSKPVENKGIEQNKKHKNRKAIQTAKEKWQNIHLKYKNEILVRHSRSTWVSTQVIQSN